MSKSKTIIISLIILLAGAAVTVLIFMTEPTASKSGATKETAMLVEVEIVNKGDFQPTFKATGVVQPSESIMLSPRVSGQVIRQSKNFIPGSVVRKGELILQIDPADYENQLQLRRSELLQAEADLNIEKGRQDIARQDYELVGDTLSGMNKGLVLRKPQLSSAEAIYKAAEASVKQAQLNLERTSIEAPFDGQVLSRNVNVGSQVSPGVNIGRLVAIDEYWIIVNVPVSKVRWLTFTEEEDEGSEVQIRDRKSWMEGEGRKGHLKKFIGALEDQTRMARLIVSVPDPLGVDTTGGEVPQLIINSFVEVDIRAEELNDVVKLNRDFLRKDNTVWVMEDGRLSIRQPEILVQDDKFVYITEGLNNRDSVVTSSLATVAEGAKLRVETDSTTTTESTNGHGR
ncbi:efflux RND transporter periplasmic adaptor subunit [Halocola ammonii]